MRDEEITVNRLKSKRWIVLIVSLALVIIVVGTGFAFSRGYLMRFIINGVEISRDEFFAMAEASYWETGITCFHNGLSLSEGYVISCVDISEAAANF